jgi:hypothetical protein
MVIRRSARRRRVALVAALLLASAVASAPAAERGAAPGTPRDSYTLAVLGDGFAEDLTEGLRADFAERPQTTIIAATHAPFGLAQDSRLDWTKVVRTLLAGPHLDAAVVMLGANDTGPLPDGDGVAPPGSERWRRLYGDRVDAVASLFRAKGVPLTWVGLPIVESEATSAAYVALNEIARDRATAAGATYVDAWSAFADEAGRYSATGPDANGQVTRLRRTDGVDLTRAGAIKLAGFVEADLRIKHAAAKAAGASPPATDIALPSQPGFDAALDVDVNAEIRREAGLPALAASPSPGRSRPGPVIAITAPVLAPDGRLAQAAPGTPAPLIGAGDTLVERTLVEGQPIAPKPGRVDDFSWPRQ